MGVLPRWLSDARTLHAETGWPRPLCRRFVSRVDRWYRWRDAVVVGPVSFVVYIVCIAPVGAAIVAMDDPMPRVLILVILFSVGAMLWLGMVGAYLSRRRARLYRVLGEFRAAPWCLECRYPVPPVEEGSAVCPECGGVIPPEIAALAPRAERE